MMLGSYQQWPQRVKHSVVAVNLASHCSIVKVKFCWACRGIAVTTKTATYVPVGTSADE